MTWQPDYRHVLDAANNRRPARLPLYEHNINVDFIALTRPIEIPRIGASEAVWQQFFDVFCDFWKSKTYDCLSFEGCVTSILPDSGALMGGRPGPIQSWEDFRAYPWDDLPRIYWDRYEPAFRALSVKLPPGMKAIGGIGNGVFEIVQDLVGYEYLGLMQYDDPELFGAIFSKVGDLMKTIWREFLQRHSDAYAVCRFGDDLGFKSATLLAPETIVEHIVPQYRRIVTMVRSAGKPFLLHSCGKIFPVMEEMIAIGINAKHSNEDQIAPFEEWIRLYGDRIALFGGIDVNDLCMHTPDDVFEKVFERGALFRNMARGFALGSGNSIPEYVPVACFDAMVAAAQELRIHDASV